MIELEHYPLAIAAEKTGYSKELLIYLAAEGKLPLFFIENGTEARVIEFDIDYETDNFGSMDKYRQLISAQSFTITKPYQIPVETIQRYCNNRDAKLCELVNPDYPACEAIATQLKDPVPFKNINKYVSAEDVARLSKKETVKTDGGEIAEMNADKALAIMALLLSNQLHKYRTGDKPNASAISKDILPIAQKLFGDDDAKFASFNRRLGKALKQFKE